MLGFGLGLGVRVTPKMVRSRGAPVERHWEGRRCGESEFGLKVLCAPK